MNNARQLPIAYCLLPIALCLLPLAYCLLPIATVTLRVKITCHCCKIFLYFYNWTNLLSQIFRPFPHFLDVQPLED